MREERALGKRSESRPVPSARHPAAICAVCTALVLAGCATATAPGRAGIGTAGETHQAPGGVRPDGVDRQAASAETEASFAAVVIGSKQSTEELIIAEMYALLLDERGYGVERKLGLDGTAATHQALVDGTIDVYPEYTAVGVIEVLELGQSDDDAENLRTLRREYEKRFGSTWLQTAPFVHREALVTTRRVAEDLKVATLSDLARAASRLRLGAPASFRDAPDGLPGLQRQYSELEFGEYVEIEEAPTRFDALEAGRVDVVVAVSTSGRIAGDDLVVLADDEGVYPTYRVAPVVRLDVLEGQPAIGNVLNLIAPLLTDEAMRQLNYEADESASGPREVARAFLADKGLIGR